MFKNTGGARLGHAAGDTDIEKQASQLASDVKYKVRKSLSGQTNLNPAQVAKAYLSQLEKSPAPSTVKAMARKKLTGGLKEEYNISQLAEDSVKSVFTKVFTEESTEKKYHIKVIDKKTGNSYTREATRAKISELRANPNIASVEMTSYGKDRDRDGKIESSSKEHAGVVHNAIQRKKGGVPDGKDTRKESVEEEAVYEAGRFHTASAQQAGFQRIKDKESGGPGVGRVRSDDEIKKEKGGEAFLDRIAKAKAKMKKDAEMQEGLDTFEKGEQERIIKGMKKDKKSFVKRYGKRDAADVMYATATKLAKKAGDTSKSDKRYAAEDKAFSNVVAILQKKYGKDSILTKDNPPKKPTDKQKAEWKAEKAKRAAQNKPTGNPYKPRQGESD